jgi:hypothetical protein
MSVIAVIDHQPSIYDWVNVSLSEAGTEARAATIPHARMAMPAGIRTRPFCR